MAVASDISPDQVRESAAMTDPNWEAKQLARKDSASAQIKSQYVDNFVKGARHMAHPASNKARQLSLSISSATEGNIGGPAEKDSGGEIQQGVGGQGVGGQGVGGQGVGGQGVGGQGVGGQGVSGQGVSGQGVSDSTEEWDVILPGGGCNRLIEFHNNLVNSRKNGQISKHEFEGYVVQYHNILMSRESILAFLERLNSVPPLINCPCQHQLDFNNAAPDATSTRCISPYPSRKRAMEDAWEETGSPPDEVCHFKDGGAIEEFEGGNKTPSPFSAKSLSPEDPMTSPSSATPKSANVPHAMGNGLFPRVGAESSPPPPYPPPQDWLTLGAKKYKGAEILDMIRNGGTPEGNNMAGNCDTG
jgi:hypothetical protein